MNGNDIYSYNDSTFARCNIDRRWFQFGSTCRINARQPTLFLGMILHLWIHDGHKQENHSAFSRTPYMWDSWRIFLCYNSDRLQCSYRLGVLNSSLVPILKIKLGVVGAVHCSYIHRVLQLSRRQSCYAQSIFSCQSVEVIVLKASHHVQFSKLLCLTYVNHVHQVSLLGLWFLLLFTVSSHFECSSSYLNQMNSVSASLVSSLS